MIETCLPDHLKGVGEMLRQPVRPVGVRSDRDHRAPEIEIPAQEIAHFIRDFFIILLGGVHLERLSVPDQRPEDLIRDAVEQGMIRTE